MVLDVIKRHDMRVLEASQRKGFSAVARCNLQHHRSIRQSRLSGQKNAAANALSQLLHEPKPAEKFPGGDPSHSLPSQGLSRRRKPMAQDIFQFLLPLREALSHLHGGLVLAPLLAETDFFVD